MDFTAAGGLYVLLMIYYGVGVGPWVVLVPVFLLLLLLFTVGVTLATSALNVFYRDVNPVVQIGLQLWLYLTPVAYPLSVVDAKYRLLFLLNPLTGSRRRAALGPGLRARAGLGCGRHFGGLT